MSRSLIPLAVLLTAVLLLALPVGGFGWQPPPPGGFGGPPRPPGGFGGPPPGGFGGPPRLGGFGGPPPGGFGGPPPGGTVHGFGGGPARPPLRPIAGPGPGGLPARPPQPLGGPPASPRGPGSGPPPGGIPRTPPGGSLASRFKGGAAIGPHGGVPGGSAAGVKHGGLAHGAYGAAAGRAAAAAGRGTAFRSSRILNNQAASVRGAVAGYPCYRSDWYRSHAGAWFAAGWAASDAWKGATWGGYASYSGTTAEPTSYDYGSNVSYQDDGVYVDGTRTASVEQYAEQATTLADSGAEAKASKEEEWLPLGVFAMVKGYEETSNHIFQLAVNKDGVIRGNYYDAVTDSTATVSGAVDKTTQRAAWRVDGHKTPTYEAGIVNLTKKETTMMVHYGKDRSVQYTLVRMEEPRKAESPE